MVYRFSFYTSMNHQDVEALRTLLKESLCPSERKMEIAGIKAVQIRDRNSRDMKAAVEALANLASAAG